jgi:hypothetical protein
MGASQYLFIPRPVFRPLLRRPGEGGSFCAEEEAAKRATPGGVQDSSRGYVLIPHDAVADNMTLEGLAKEYGVK